MKLYALCAALALTNIAHADTDDASQILQHARAASGGDAWNTVAALHAKGEEHAAGLTAQWQGIDDLHGGRNAQHADFGVFKIAEGFDDREHWRMDRSEAVHALDSTFARSATATDAWLARRGWLRAGADGAMLSAASNRTDAGHTYNVVTATPRNGQPVELWFDAQTGLLARNVRVMPISIQTTRYDDYRDVAGVKLPFAITTDHGEAGEEDRIAIKEYRADTAKAADFARPAPRGDVSIPPKGVTVPLEVDGYVTVEAKLNGKTYAFILDTGGHDIVTPDVVKALGLKSAGAGASGGAGEGTIAEQDTRIARVEIGDAVLSDQHFYVIPLQYNTVERGDRPLLGGILGLEIFERFAVRLDYKSKTLTLKPTQNYRYTGRGTAVPMTFGDDMPLIEATFDGVRGDFAIDTGNGGTMLVQHVWAEQHGLAQKMKAGLETVSYGAGGASRNWASRGARFGVGSHAFDDVVARYAEDAKGSFSSRTEAGNLGTDILAHFTIEFDYAHGKVWLEPESSFAPPPFDRSGLRAYKNKADAFSVVLVGPDTPAAQAGIAKDDEITAVDGVAAQHLSGWDLKRKLRQAPGTRVTLTLTREGKPREVTIELREILRSPKS